MSNDTDWVADVRRWYFASQQDKVVAPSVTEGSATPQVPCQAARPAMQARCRPEAARTGFSDLK